MTLVSVFTFTIGPAIAKAIIKGWLKDSGVFSDIVPELLDLLKASAQDEREQRQAARRIETLGVQVVQQMQPIFDDAGRSLNAAGRTTAARELAVTLAAARIQPRMLIECNLDPALLSRQLAAARPDAAKLLSAAESALYERLLDEAARNITEIASELNGFTSAFSAAALQDQDKILAMLADLWRRPADADQEFQDKYNDIVQKQLDKLELFGLPTWDEAARTQRLTRVYITLQFKQPEFIDADSLADESQLALFDLPNELGLHLRSATMRADRMAPQKGDIQQVLAFTRRLVIRGDAGSGKSTLLQWLAVCSAGRSFSGALSSWNSTIPFFIRLRERVERNFPLPEEFPYLIAKTIAGTMPQGWAHRQLEAGRALVLIDGVDELPQAKREELLQALAELVSAYPLARYIVTSRPSALKQDDWPAWSHWTSDEGFAEATLQPMAPDQVNLLIQQWHAALAEKISDPDERAEIRQLPAALLRTLRLRPVLRRLTPNPLLCSMICALHRESRENLPSERLKLYEECVELLLTKRDRGRTIALGPEYAHLTPGQQRALVQNFAYWMMRNNYSDVSVEEADAQFQDRLPAIGATPETTGETVRRLFVERTNLLREPIDDRIDFTHRTFEEFLAAQQAVKDSDFGFLVGKATDDQWRELIILVAGIARPKEAASFLRRLVKRAQELKRAPLRHRVLLLAVACLETCVELDPIVRAEIIEQAGTIFPPKDDDEARLVAAAGDPAVPLLAYNPQHAPAVAVACVRALAQIGSTAAMHAIAAYMAHPEPEVGEAIIDAWELFERAEYARQVLAKSDSLVIPLLTTWDGFAHLGHLKALAIAELAPDLDLEPLVQLTALTTFSLGFNVVLPDLQVSPARQTRFFERRSQIADQHQKSAATTGRTRSARLGMIDLTPLAKLPALKHLSLSTNAIEPSSLAVLTNLTRLELRDIAISDLTPLAALTNLTELFLSNSAVSDLTPLATLTNLTELFLSSPTISDLMPLAALTNLTLLSLIDTASSDLTPLAALTNLTRLTLLDTAISDLTPLAALTNLTRLTLLNTAISDLTPLAALTNLTLLWLAGNKLIDDSQLAKLQSALPQLKVSKFG